MQNVKADTAGTNTGHDQSRRAAAGQDGQQDHRISRPRDDQIGADRPPRGAVPAAGRQGCRARGQDDPRRHGRKPGEGGAHRDPRVRQLRPQLPAAANRTQSQVRREGAGAGEARPALQGRQGIARAGRFQEAHDATRGESRTARPRGDAARFLRRWQSAMQIVRWIVGATLFLALLFLSLQNSRAR